jgi:hypothetical protein
VNSVSVKVLLAAAAALCCGTVQAATLKDTLSAFGFFGTWAVDCAQPASPVNNYRSAYVSQTGDPVFSESLGSNSEPNIYVILRARQEGKDRIVLRVKINGEFEQELTIRKEGNRLRTITNRDLDRHRKYVVRNGEVLSTGGNTPWLTRCDAPPPQSAH